MKQFFILISILVAGICHSSIAQISVEQNGNRFLIEIISPQLKQTSTLKGDRFELENFAHGTEASQPRLPVKGFLIHIPTNAEVLNLDIIDLNSDRFYGSPMLNPIDERSRKSPEKTTSIYPERVAELGETGYLRSAHFVRLQVNPVQYDSTSGEIIFHKRIFLQLTLNFLPQAPLLAGAANGLAPEIFEAIYSETLTNYTPEYCENHLRNFSRGDTSGAAPVASKNDPDLSFHLIVDRDGIYRLPFDYLLEHGINLKNANPRTVKIRNKGEDIPIYVSTENDGKFDRWDYIEFYGEHNRGTYSIFGEYTHENVYELTWSEDPLSRDFGARIPLENADVTNFGVEDLRTTYRENLHFEQDQVHGQLSFADANRDRWFWKTITGTENVSFDFELPGFMPDGSVVVRVMAHGNTFFTHQLQVKINEVDFDRVSWEAQKPFIFELTLEKGLVSEVENRLNLRLISSDARLSDQIFVNWFEVDYLRKYEANQDRLRFQVEKHNNSTQPVITQLDGFSSKAIDLYRPGVSKLTNFEVIEHKKTSEESSYSIRFADEIFSTTEYLALTFDRKLKPKRIVKNVPSDLRDRSNRVDYIIITADQFYDEALRFAQYRGRKMYTKVVKVQDIYDEFNHGIFSPEAIRDFLRYAYFNWRSPAPSYVLLVGDATWDFKSGENQVPSYYRYARQWGPAASDHLFVCVNGDDGFPEMLIGRLPVHFPSEARNVFDKNIRYEQSPNLGVWRTRSLFLAGKSNPASPLERFEGDSDELVDRFLAPGHEPIKAYADPANRFHGTTDDIVENWNEGISFIHFTGHGGGGIWADARLFTFDDVRKLTNEDKLPVVTSFTCFTGYFDDPYIGGLNESLVTMAHGGAIAAIGSSGLGWAKGDFYLEEDFFEALFVRKAKDLGTALFTAKIALLTDYPQVDDLAYLYNLLGDAALNFAVPQNEIETIVTKQIDSKLELSGHTDEKFNGQVAIRVVDPIGHELMSPHHGFVSGGKMSIELPFPNANFAPGTDLVIRLYAWDDRTQEELIGGTKFRIAGNNDADLSVFNSELKIKNIGDGLVEFSVKIYNVGHKDAENVPIKFYEGNPTGSTGGVADVAIGEVEIAKIEAGQFKVAKIEWSPTIDATTIYVKIDPESKIVEANKENNFAKRFMILNRHSIESGNSELIFSHDGNFSAELRTLESVELGIEKIVLPIVQAQPNLKYVPLLSLPNGGGYKVSPIDRSELPPENLRIEFRSSSTADVVKGKVMVGRWNVLTERWEKLNAEPIGNEIFSAVASEWGTFTLLRSDDETPPEIDFEIIDRQFELDGEFTSLDATVLITATDPNGLSEVNLKFDGAELNDNDFERTGNLSDANRWQLSYSPSLAPGTHRLTAFATDTSGNSSQRKLEFRSSGILKVKGFSNHPNPVRSEETWFSYLLTAAANSVKIKIYGTSGRLITELDAPSEQGYNELPWNLVDRDGEALPNGVYFYTITISADEELASASTVKKLAIVRE